jgi:AraC-like DNA-binding protein
LHYQEYKPSKTLQPYIASYYTLDCEPGTSINDQAFATGCMEVMFTLEGEPWQTRKNGLFTNSSPVELWGQILNPLPFRASGASRIFGIRFFPATAAILLKGDISQFNDQVLPLDSVACKSFMHLHEQLCEADTVVKRIALVEFFLHKQLIKHQELEKIDLIRNVMQELAQKDFFDTIHSVAGRYGISSRYLQTVFLRYTGLTPKLYSQINRFQNSLVLLSKSNRTLTEVAYQSGYFDQSHFIREFKSFTGFAPSAFPIENSTAVLASPAK